MLYACRFTLVEGARLMCDSLCFMHAALLYASLYFMLCSGQCVDVEVTYIHTHALMLCSLGFAVSNVDDFDNLSRYLQLVVIHVSR